MSKKILFVCLGNICRSPLAEGLMLHLNDKHQLNWTIDSAGTSNYHVGEGPDNRTVTNAEKNGINLRDLRARQFSSTDFDHFDHILAMDRNNYHNIISLAQTQQQKDKVKLFLQYSLGAEPHEVPDPYYGDESGFERVFQLVKSGCEGLMLRVK